MTEQQLKEKYALYTDSWKFYRKWAVQTFPLTEEQWAQIVKEAEELREKHGHLKSVEYIALSVVQGLEELEKAVRK